MICKQVFDSISIHANGDIVCWCADVEGKRVYGNVFVDRIADVYNGPAYREIREWMLRSRPDSWCPAIESHCSSREIPATTDLDTSGRRIKTLKLEPVTYCNLKCPACPVETGFKQIAALKETRAQKLLPLATMLDVVAQLPDLETIEYFDFGEPFLHKDTITFLREVRRTRPGVQIVTSTNGTVLTPAQIQALAAEALMDRIVFSIDGATPESYRKYRVGGSFDKAFGKMKALLDACRAAGTWRKYVTEPPGQVQITWQYILFEWNDSDEELALARQLAKSIDVPIEWIITSGYGASKRFLYGSAEAARLMDPPDSFICGWHVDHRLNEKLQKKIQVSCDLLSLPYILSVPIAKPMARLWTSWAHKLRRVVHGDAYRYRAHISADDTSIAAPASSTVLFDISVENKTNQSWDVGQSDYLRLGLKLTTNTGEIIRDLSGVILPPGVARPGGRDNIVVSATLPERPGEYKLLIDLAQERVCWFSERGSPPLICAVRIE